MKKWLMTFLAVLMLAAYSDQIKAQDRLSQFEIFLGANLPLAPDGFKDFYTMGISANVQYVFFPSANIGIPIFGGYEFFTEDTDAISSFYGDFLVGVPVFDPYYYNPIGEVTEANFSTEGSANVIRFGAGLRPYLTPPTASTQLFLFGNATYNLIKTKSKVNSGTATWTDYFYGESFEVSEGEFNDFFGLDQSFFEEFESSINKFGIGIGAGLEMPAGDNVNLILQGVFNLVLGGSEEITFDDLGNISTEDVNTSFVGITAGLVF